MSDAQKCSDCGAVHEWTATEQPDGSYVVSAGDTAISLVSASACGFSKSQARWVGYMLCKRICLERQLAQAEERVKALKKALADMWTLRQEAANARDGARADVERLQAIVDRLPKTADGVPLVPGMTVFIPHPHPSNLITERVVLAPYGTRACLTKEPAHSGCCESATHRQARECYSTREAALAAREGRGSEGSDT